MWPGFSPPETMGNGLRTCCGREPTLRVKGNHVHYECRTCGRHSPHSTGSEVEARVLWVEEIAFG